MFRSSSSIELGKVNYINGYGDLSSCLNKSKVENRMVILYFTMPGCRPCAMLAPHYESLASTHSTEYFLKADIASQSNGELASYNNVSAFPTILFYLKGNEVGRVRGADLNALKNELFKHMVVANAEREKFNSSGKVLGGDGSSNDVINVKVIKTDGTTMAMKFPRSNTSLVKHLRDRMCLSLRIDMNAYKIIFKGKVVKDDELLDSLGFFNTDPVSIHIVEDRVGSKSASSSSTAAPVPSSSFKWSESSPTNLDVVTKIYQSEIPIYDQIRKRCIDLAMTYLTNIVEHPSETKYQRIRSSNAHFKKNIADVTGGMKLMDSVGFHLETVDGVEYLSLKASSLTFAKHYLNHLRDITSRDSDASRLEMIGFKNKSEDGKGATTIEENEEQLKQALNSSQVATEFVESKPELVEARNKMLEKGAESIKTNPTNVISAAQINIDMVKAAMDAVAKMQNNGN